MSLLLALPPPRRTLLGLDVYFMTPRDLVAADVALTLAIRYTLNLPFEEYDSVLVDELKEKRSDARHAALCELRSQVEKTDQRALERKLWRRQNKERRRLAA